MHRPIQLTKTTSSRRTSQVTRPDDNKAIGNCFHALLAGLRPASLILARRIAIPLLLLSAGMVLVQPCAGQSGTWTETGSLNTARDQHTATLLPNGKVLVAGGMATARLASAELYDPASGTWTATGSLATARYDHTATLLPNGKVLVAGGMTTAPSLSRARNSTIRRAGPGRPPAASPPHADCHTATLLPNGKVLVAGGFDSGVYSRERGTLRSGERDLDGHRQPRHRTLCSHGDVAAQRQGARRRRLNGSVSLASAELYDPASGTWTATGSLATARYCSHGDVAAQRQGARRRRI